jgi:hypothetical protein
VVNLAALAQTTGTVKVTTAVTCAVRLLPALVAHAAALEQIGGADERLVEVYANEVLPHFHDSDTRGRRPVHATT